MGVLSHLFLPTAPSGSKERREQFNDQHVSLSVVVDINHHIVINLDVFHLHARKSSGATSG